MADARTEYIDNLFVTTWRNVRAKVVDQVMKITPLTAKLLREGGRRETEVGGRFIDIPIRKALSDQNVKWFGKGDTFSLGEKEFLDVLSYEMRYLGTSIVRYWADDQKNRGKAKLLDYAEQKINSARDALSARLEQDLFVPNPSGNAIYSLQELIADDPTTGIVAGKDRSANEYMRNLAVDFSGLTFSNDFERTIRNAINTLSRWEGVQRRPNLIITTQEIYEAIEDLLVALRQIVAVRSENASLGFGDIAIKGIEVNWAPECPDGHLYLINTNHFQVVVDTYANFEMGEWQPIPNTAGDRVAIIKAVLQLVCDNFRKQGVIYNISTS